MIGGIRPVVQEGAEVDEGVAERRHVPVEDREDPVRIGRIELTVVELEVVVDDRDAAQARQAAREASVERVDRGRRVLEAREPPPLGPSLQLPLHEPGRSAEIPEVTRVGIEPVQLGHGVDEREGDPSADLAMTLHPGRDRGAHDFATAALHHEKVGAEDGGVVAEDVRARGPVEVAPEPREDLVLTAHVVGAGSDLPHRRPPQDELLGTDTQEVRQVRRAVRELKNLDGTAGAAEGIGEPRTQPGVQCVAVQLLAAAHRRGLGRVRQRDVGHAIPPGRSRTAMIVQPVRERRRPGVHAARPRSSRYDFGRIEGSDDCA